MYSKRGFLHGHGKVCWKSRNTHGRTLVESGTQTIEEEFQIVDAYFKYRNHNGHVYPNVKLSRSGPTISQTTQTPSKTSHNSDSSKGYNVKRECHHEAHVSRKQERHVTQIIRELKPRHSSTRQTGMFTVVYRSVKNFGSILVKLTT